MSSNSYMSKKSFISTVVGIIAVLMAAGAYLVLHLGSSDNGQYQPSLSPVGLAKAAENLQSTTTPAKAGLTAEEKAATKLVGTTTIDSMSPEQKSDLEKAADSLRRK